VSGLHDLFLLLESLRHAGFAGPVILGCAALYLLLGLVACGRPLSRRTSVLAGLTAVAGAGVLGGGLALVIEARHHVLSSCARDAERCSNIAFERAIERSEAGLGLLALGFLWTAVFGGVAAARSALGRRPEEAPPSIVVTSVLAFGGLLGGLLLARALGTVPAMQNNTSDAARGMIEAAAPVHGRAGAAMIAAAVIAGALAALFCWRAERGGARPPGSGLFRCGRARARSRSSGMPPDDPCRRWPRGRT
jgi:hypothetical protein